MSTTTTADLVVAGYRRMADSGLVAGSAGNVSVRTGAVMAITPASIRAADVRAADVCTVELGGALDDRPRAASGARASSEWMLHRAVYAGSDAGAVVHTHSAAAVAVSLVCDELPAIHYYIARFGDRVPVVPYATYGSAELAKLVADAAGSASAVLMRNHGAVVHAATLDDALERAALLEWLCDVYLRAAVVGRPAVVSAEQLDAVRAQSLQLSGGDRG